MTKLCHCEWEIALCCFVLLCITQIDLRSILASCRTRFGRTRPYYDHKLVAKMEEEKLIESVRDFPCFLLLTKVSIASSSSLPESIVHAMWAGPKFSIDVVT